MVTSPTSGIGTYRLCSPHMWKLHGFGVTMALSWEQQALRQTCTAHLHSSFRSEHSLWHLYGLKDRVGWDPPSLLCSICHQAHDWGITRGEGKQNVESEQEDTQCFHEGHVTPSTVSFGVKCIDPADSQTPRRAVLSSASQLLSFSVILTTCCVCHFPHWGLS